MDQPTVRGRPYVNLPLQAVLDLHGELLAEHGGAPGIRDLGALEASLARPYQLIAYGDELLTIFDLAAAACASVCRNHPFVDGNKRAAFVTLGLILGLNGFELDASEREAADVILALAAGQMEEAAFRNWVADHSYDISDLE
ncbi:type II toxin-antitoxin system death-on-curing family toxin [Azospirillum sp.]|uniref:type II toxin-antitoxin system death-on-curing family toxin n=1 Tax=Azospirillum sp. TaxID=34012 RepID=UPI002D664E68|nr:type II toxin-antitoxin system death-on-curing family toxin [Azospirillum sp.]HYF84863.1 type II toxin-antitoxin system death-on-curing family toxin [Azospirillum sp.]